MKPALRAVLEALEDKGFSDPLLAPEELLDDICSRCCFDLHQVATRMSLNHRGTKALNAHLALDHVVTRFLYDILIDGPTVRVERLSFDQKVELLYSLGHLSDRSREWSKKLNRLRNKLAHELDFSVSNAQVEEFTALFEKDGRPLSRSTLTAVLLATVLSAEEDRTDYLRHEVESHLTLLRAKKLLGRLASSGLPRDEAESPVHVG